MSYVFPRKRSTYWWFRMEVPARHRAAVGKTAWWKSLKTRDYGEAEQRVLEHIARYKQLIDELDGRAATSRTRLVERLIDQAMTKAATLHGSMDRAVVHQLVFLTMHVGSGWTIKRALGDVGMLLDDDALIAMGINLEPAAFDDETARKAFDLRARIIEGRGIVDGLVYQEVARRLLARREFNLAYPVLLDLVRGIADPYNLVTTAYDDVAEACLTRLAEHTFTGWPNGVFEALGPLGFPEPGALPPAQETAPAAALEGLRAMLLSEALAYWERRRAPGRSAITEATRAVDRFIALFGDLAIGHISRAQVIEFRDLVADIEPQTELAKLKASGKTLRGAIEEHRARLALWKGGDHSGPQPKRIAPGSVKKDVSAISQILGKVADDLGEATHAASNVKIDGYSKTKKGQAKPRLPFTPAMMQSLFDSPLFTGCAGPSDIERTRPGPHVYQDELYWPFLFGVIGGPRLEEIGQIALSDIHPCDLHRTFDGEYEGDFTFIHITGTGEAQQVKNDGSDRYVVLHDRLIELGFNDYVARRRAAGATHLFDLSVDNAGKHTKVLSNRLNRYIDRVVTEDPRYVFYSMRHEFTDRAELSMIPARVANSIKGHAHDGVADRYGVVSMLAQYLHLKKLKVSFIDWPRLIAAAGRSAASQ